MIICFIVAISIFLSISAAVFSAAQVALIEDEFYRRHWIKVTFVWLGWAVILVCFLLWKTFH